MKFKFDIEENCSCSKTHKLDADVITGAGVRRKIPEILKKYNAKKVYIVSDINTHKAAGDKVRQIVKDSGIDIYSYVLIKNFLNPMTVT